MKNIKYILISSFILFLGVNVSAQQIPHNNFYMQNPFVINPAATGLQGSVAAFADYRDQWAGLKGAPETFHAGVHGLVTEAMGVGLNIKQNKTGIFRQFSVDLDYSYRISLASEQSLAFGLQLGFMQNNLNTEEMIADDDTDPALFSSSLINEALVQSGFGIHYNWKTLDVHLSSPLIYGMQEKRFLQTAFANVSYGIMIAEDIWKIQPSLLYRYTEYGISQVDVNVLAEWDKKIWAMGGYRTNKNIMFGAGIFLKTIGIGYVYEINRSILSTVSSGSHEVMINFESPFSVTKKTPLYRDSKRRNAWN